MHRESLFANGWKGCLKRLKPKQLLTMRTTMTTENQNAIIAPKKTTIGNTEANSRAEYSVKFSTTLEEKKGNVLKPLCLRPNRSVKKNNSLKPLGLRSR